MSKAERAAEVYRRLDATSRSLENFSVAELGGITLGYDIKISNLGSKRKSDLIKVLGRGKLKAKVNVTAHYFSATAAKAVEKAGGKIKKLINE